MSDSNPDDNADHDADEHADPDAHADKDTHPDAEAAHAHPDPRPNTYALCRVNVS